jgi:hypothetical protein
MPGVIQELSDVMRVWPHQVTPDSSEYDAVVFEYTKGNCWDVVRWMVNIRQEYGLSVVCCFNTNWGLAGTSLHCVVDSFGPHWFNSTHELVQGLKNMVAGNDSL